MTHALRVLLAALACVTSGAAWADPPPAGEAGPSDGRAPPRWYVMPNVAFDSDDGLGFGVRGEVALNAPGFAPYRQAFVLHAFASLRGYHHHRFRYDRVGLGPEGRLRVTLHVAWRHWLNDGYWGLGNRTAREPGAINKRYRYSLFQPFTHLTLRARLAGPWQTFASVNAKWSEVRTYAGSLLARQRPLGMDGGLTTLWSAGVLYDTRQPEITPKRGTLTELSGRVAPPLPRGAGTFGGPFVSLRAYLPVTPWLVFATRVMGEWLFGDVPFYEMVHWGGAIPVAGVGGFETLRGSAFGRWHAPGKAVLNTEWRFDVLQHGLFSEPLLWQIVPFADLGVVWGGGETADNPRGGWPLHPTAGLGVRAVYADAFVGRIDAGLGLDPVQRADGRIEQDLSWGLYVVFDHTF